MTERTTRRHAEQESSQHATLAGDAGAIAGDAPGATAPDEFRIDLERIRFSSYFARLSDVTQVVPQTGVGPVMHNRLTHSLKVSAVARVIAANLASAEARHLAYVRGERSYDDATGAVVAKLGGCDTVVTQSAAHAHDLGHPPFGHLGERVLDRIAREQLGLPEGFEGNAQSFRILVQLDTLGRDFPGLNLTAATRAATLKYPWTRAEWIGRSTEDLPVSERPRGVGLDPVAGAEKFSVYALDSVEMEQALAAFPQIESGRQTVECAVMDLADDIAYAVHDLDDFARAGVLQQAAVASEFRTWLAGEEGLAAEVLPSLEARRRAPGASLELLWRRLHTKDAWIADRDAFTSAVQRVSDDIGESLLATPYDGGIDSERAMSGFTRRWIEHLRTSIEVEERPHVRSGHVRLNRQAWHEVMVLKFVHSHFVLDRPELALPQRGMAKVISDLTLGFDAWLTDPDDATRAPRRMIEWADEVTDASFAARALHPEQILGDTSDAALRRQGRARAILDYVSSLSDQQAITTHRTLLGG
ncbi:MAG: deoxyguanosinetriphosphate triphosphohydrolase family protein [Leucobacter sp.]